MSIIVFITASIGLLLLFNWLMGYRKGNITIDFEERYFNQKEYVEAIKNKLENEGREVYYEGNGRFKIDGKHYLFIERNVSMGGVPMQRTILKLDE
ncbi:hypothetical protein E2626_11065 [Jeotgalibacillus salarius]|uniref:Uncharacterized protein n=1 Tax=Jeotgalibacillus salarius TaxID=546023 RepID=A0A4Y8LFA2_9BACL|nr:hypothetical protein E2626_11065 [Jeotgalibacillus salarius]